MLLVGPTIAAAAPVAPAEDPLSHTHIWQNDAEMREVHGPLLAPHHFDNLTTHDNDDVMSLAESDTISSTSGSFLDDDLLEVGSVTSDQSWASVGRRSPKS